MHYWIVLEGGGTTTNGVLLSENGDVVAHKRAGGSNPLFIPLEEAAERVRRIICDLAQMRDVQDIYCFIPGMSELSGVLEPRLPACNIRYEGDVMPALFAAFGDEPGIVVLAGTGSFACGRNTDGDVFTVGGYGPLFSDFGSGYDIGRRVLAKAVQIFDAGDETSLTRAVMNAFHIDTIAALRRLQSNGELFDRAHIAVLARLAADCAEEGDADAQTILAEAAGELARLAVQCAKRMGAEKSLCSLTGGICNIGQWIVQPFIAQLQKEAPGLLYIKARYVPIVGACLYVQKQNGCALTGDYLMQQLTERGFL